jgi:hypothetical protein
MKESKESQAMLIQNHHSKFDMMPVSHSTLTVLRLPIIRFLGLEAMTIDKCYMKPRTAS